MQEYVTHYLKTTESYIFMAITLVALVAVLVILYLYTCLRSGGLKGAQKRSFINNEFNSLMERFFEIVFSGGSILMFMTVYYLINRFYFVEPYRTYWDKYKDFLLLLLIIISILFNRLIDNVLIRLKYTAHEEKAAIRFTGMIYMLLIFGYIKFIYENNNYDMFISYFLGLTIGRFVYFDVSFSDLTSSIKGAIRNLPLMILALAYLSFLAWYGFGNGFLIKHIGVVTNVFFIHVYMTICIFLVFHVYHLLNRRR